MQLSYDVYNRLVTAVCPYTETSLAYNRVLENASDVLESPGNFCNQESGNLDFDVICTLLQPNLN